MIGKHLLTELIGYLETHDPDSPHLTRLRTALEKAEPVGWYDATTRKFAQSPNAFPRAAKIMPLYRCDD